MRSRRATRRFPHTHAGSLTQRSDRKSTRLNSSHGYISYAVFCLKRLPSRPRSSHFPYTTLFRSERTRRLIAGLAHQAQLALANAESWERLERTFVSTVEALANALEASDEAVSSHARWISDTALRSEEHTSELQSRLHLVCRLLLEKAS